MRLLILAAGTAMALSGCEKPVEEMGYAERQALAGDIVQRCAALGIQPETAQMRDCTSTEVQKEIHTRRANAGRRANVGLAMQQYGQSMQQQAQQNTTAQQITNQPSYVIPSRQVFCRSQAHGNTVNTNCY